MANLDVNKLEQFYRNTPVVDKDQIIISLIEKNKALVEQLEIVENNLRRGLSKSLQKFQARCIREVIEENETPI